MGKINETLTLTDQFSSSFHTFINLGEQALSMYVDKIIDKTG